MSEKESAMVEEFYTEEQEWPILLPPEPDRDRYVVVRNADGSPHPQFFRHNGKLWIGVGTFGYGLSWPTLVKCAMKGGLTLASRPSPDAT